MNTMHSFIDFIPNILVGAPSEDNFLSILPGHRLFLQGKGLLGIQLTILGNLGGILISLGVLPIYWLFAQQTKGFLVKTIPWALLTMTVLLVASERKNQKKLVALGVAGLAGALGVIALRLASNQLFALVTGFFGMSTLLFSLYQSKPKIVQQTKIFKLKTRKAWKAIGIGGICGSLVSLFPAISSAHAAFVAQSIHQKFGTKQFLVLLGAINASSMVFSFVALQVLGKARTGSAVAIQFLYELSMPDFLVVLATILLSAGIAALTTILIAKKVLTVLQKISYPTLSKSIMVLLAGLTIWLSGFLGLLVLLVATSIGLISHLQGIKKSHCMAFLVVPTILFYWGF